MFTSPQKEDLADTLQLERLLKFQDDSQKAQSCLKLLQRNTPFTGTATFECLYVVLFSLLLLFFNADKKKGGGGGGGRENQYRNGKGEVAKMWK